MKSESIRPDTKLEFELGLRINHINKIWFDPGKCGSVKVYNNDITEKPPRFRLQISEIHK